MEMNLHLHEIFFRIRLFEYFKLNWTFLDNGRVPITVSSPASVFSSLNLEWER